MITQKTICNKENGQVIEFREYTNGKLTTLEKYHPNGQTRYRKTPTVESYYDQNAFYHGPHREYTENGHILRKEFYIKGAKHGTQFSYYNRFKRVIHTVENYYHGTKDGKQFGFYPKGTISNEITCFKGKQTSSISFTPDGEIYRFEM